MSGTAGKVYTVTFSINGKGGTNATSTVLIPLKSVPGGLIATVYLDGSVASNQSYTQGANNYNVTFSSHFKAGSPSGGGKLPGGNLVAIEFAPPGGIPEFPSQTGIALLVAAVVVASFVALRRLSSDARSLMDFNVEAANTQRRLAVTI